MKDFRKKNYKVTKTDKMVLAALDPIGFQRERQLQGNPVDETSAGFWSFSYHSQKDDTSTLNEK